MMSEHGKEDLRESRQACWKIEEKMRSITDVSNLK